MIKVTSSGPYVVVDAIDVLTLGDLDGLFKGAGAILVALGMIIVIATARTLTAEEKRIGRPSR